MARSHVETEAKKNLEPNKHSLHTNSNLAVTNMAHQNGYKYKIIKMCGPYTYIATAWPRWSDPSVHAKVTQLTEIPGSKCPVEKASQPIHCQKKRRSFSFRENSLRTGTWLATLTIVRVTGSFSLAMIHPHTWSAGN